MAGFASSDEDLPVRARFAFAKMEGIASALSRDYPGIGESLKEAIADMHAAWCEQADASAPDPAHQMQMEG